MPKQKNNIVMRSTRGMFGKQVVFKERNGKTYVSAPPEVNENRQPTDKQSAAQEKFRNSVDSALEAMDNPELKSLYAEKAKNGLTPYNVAFKDAYNPPEVKGAITLGYLGQPGNIIVVQAKDDFMVKSVTVAIYNAADDLIEEGVAVASGKINWIYTVTQVNASVTGTKIIAKAYDLPGNEGSLEITV